MWPFGSSATQSATTSTGGRSMALAGLLCGIAGIVMALFIFVMR